MIDLSFFFIREQVIKAVRDFFFNQGFHEVIVPVLNDAIPLEPNIHPFKTERFYLSTSPEKHLKKMLALGIGNCFSIGHSFRNLEASGPLHSPEFLMLEWYRKNADYQTIMDDVQDLLVSIYRYINTYSFGKELSSKKWLQISLVDLFKKYCGLDLKEIILHNQALLNYAKKKGYQTKNASWEELYDQIFVNEIEPLLPLSPLFLIDFPARISPLCKPKKNEPYLAERFELYIDRIELANGNTENTDYRSILKLFKTEQSSRSSLTSHISPISLTSPIPPIDLDFLNSLKKMQNASYAGVGLGIDRLIMLFSDTHSIHFL